MKKYKKPDLSKLSDSMCREALEAVVNIMFNKGDLLDEEWDAEKEIGADEISDLNETLGSYDLVPEEIANVLVSETGMDVEIDNKGYNLHGIVVRVSFNDLVEWDRATLHRECAEIAGFPEATDIRVEPHDFNTGFGHVDLVFWGKLR